MTERQKANLGSNVALIALELAGLVLLFALPIKIGDVEQNYKQGHIFKFYTTDSNILLLVASIIVVISLLLQGKSKIKQIPEGVKFIKLLALATTTLTMMSVLVFVPIYPSLGETSPGDMFMYSNLFYHLLAPLGGVISYLLFESKPKFKGQVTLFTMIPTAIYAIIYLSIALTHLGQDANTYDGYGLQKMANFICGLFPSLQTTIITILVVLSIILSLGFTFLFAGCLWYGNKKINIKSLGPDK